MSRSRPGHNHQRCRGARPSNRSETAASIEQHQVAVPAVENSGAMDQPTRSPVSEDAGHHQDHDGRRCLGREKRCAVARHSMLQALTRGGFPCRTNRISKAEDWPRSSRRAASRCAITSHQPHRLPLTPSPLQRVRSTPGWTSRHTGQQGHSPNGEWFAPGALRLPAEYSKQQKPAGMLASARRAQTAGVEQDTRPSRPAPDSENRDPH